jgi:succinoglycan biosynthesis transport protein ExoP
VVAIGTESGGTQDLRTYVRIFWRWRFLFLAIVVVIPFAVYFLESGKPKTYQSSTLIELQDVSVSLGSTSAPVQTGNIDAVARLVTTTPVAKVAGRLVHPPQDPGFMVKAVTATADSNTGFITIAAQAGTPQLAADIANAFAGALGVHQAQDAARTIRQQIQGQLAQLKVAKGGQARGAILGQITQLRGLLDSVNSGSQVIQPAQPNLSPVGPHVRRTVELSLVIALLIAIGAVVVAESMDRRLRNADDLERLTGWPLLAVIPRGAFDAETASPAEEEAFQMLRAAMTYFNAEERPASVAVVSPLIEDGKTTVAVGLAAASARAGIRTILVDADLRRPQVASRLGMDTSTDGLAEVLAGDTELDDALVNDVIDSPKTGSLTVLPSGHHPANPAALLNSRRMIDVLRGLEERSELVVIDTAAALAVSDALPVIQSAAAVIMVVRMNRSSRAAVRRMKKVVSSTDARVLGVVATGSGSAAAGYGDYYGKRGRSLFRRRSSSSYHTYSSGRNGARADAGADAGAGAEDKQAEQVTDA